MDVPYIQLNFVYETLKDMTSVHYGRSLDQRLGEVATKVNDLKNKYEMYRRSGRKENEDQPRVSAEAQKTTTAQVVVPPRTNPVVEIKSEVTERNNPAVVTRASSTVTVSDDEPVNSAVPMSSSAGLVTDVIVVGTPDKGVNAPNSSAAPICFESASSSSQALTSSSALPSASSSPPMESARSGSNPRLQLMDVELPNVIPNGSTLVPTVPVAQQQQQQQPNSYPTGQGGKPVPRTQGRPLYLASTNPTPPPRPTPPVAQQPPQNQQLPNQQVQQPAPFFVQPTKHSFPMASGHMPLGTSQSFPIQNQMQQIQFHAQQQRQLQAQQQQQFLAQVPMMAPQGQRQLVQVIPNLPQQLQQFPVPNGFNMHNQAILQQALLQQQFAQQKQQQQQQQFVQRPPVVARHIRHLKNPVMRITGSEKLSANSISIQFTADDLSLPNGDHSVQTVFDKDTRFCIYERAIDGSKLFVTEYKSPTQLVVPASLELTLDASGEHWYSIGAVCPGAAREIGGEFALIS